MAGAPLVWLHACTPRQAAAARVLARVIEDERPDLRLHQTLGDDARIPALSGPGALLTLGEPLPTPLVELARVRGFGLFGAELDAPAPTGLRRLFPSATQALLPHYTRLFLRGPAPAAWDRSAPAPFEVTGPLSRFAPAPGCDADALDALRAALGTRPRWYAGPVPEPEAALIVNAQAQVLRQAHRALLLAQPATPAAAAALSRAAQEAGLSLADMGAGDDPGETAQVALIAPGQDTGIALRGAPLCFLGGSFHQAADTGIAETAAALGSALIFGPDPGPDVLDLVLPLAGADAALQVVTPLALGEAVAGALQPGTAAAMALRAWTLTTEGSEATVQVARALCAWLDEREDRA